jgi:hypothetical protein
MLGQVRDLLSRAVSVGKTMRIRLMIARIGNIYNSAFEKALFLYPDDRLEMQYGSASQGR